MRDGTITIRGTDAHGMPLVETLKTSGGVVVSESVFTDICGASFERLWSYDMSRAYPLRHIRRHWPRKARRRFERALALVPVGDVTIGHYAQLHCPPGLCGTLVFDA